MRRRKTEEIKWVFTMTDRLNIILLSIDALRPDHLRSHGYNRETSLFLNGLADRELEFMTVISESSHAREAVPALLSGCYPDVFAANGYRCVPETVADRLSETGFRTAGFHLNSYDFPSAIDQGEHERIRHFDTRGEGWKEVLEQVTDLEEMASEERPDLDTVPAEQQPVDFFERGSAENARQLEAHNQKFMTDTYAL